MQRKSFLAFGRPLHKNVVEIVGKTYVFLNHHFELLTCDY